MNKTSELIKIAQNLVSDTHEFHSIKGPGKGDHATKDFMRTMREIAHNAFGKDYSEAKISGDTNFAVDFWFPDEMTIVEFALTLRNSSSEFHKDIFKALLATDNKVEIERLVFVTKPGGRKRHREPASQAVMGWLKKKYNITVTIEELE
jgi:hypothetical protein